MDGPAGKELGGELLVALSLLSHQSALDKYIVWLLGTGTAFTTLHKNGPSKLECYITRVWKGSSVTNTPVACTTNILRSSRNDRHE
jgi:hypothetical protein